MLRSYLQGAIVVGTALLTRNALASEQPPPFRNPGLAVDERVSDLISRLSEEEKVGQLMMASPGIPRLGIPAYDWWNEALHGVARNGVATVFPQAIGLAATWDTLLHERIAGAISTEARAKNNALVGATGGASGRYQGLTIWSPNINIFRDPRWGRGQETYGEDPFLTSRFAVAFVRGLQGDDPRYLKTVATLKHFAVHSGPEESRHRFDAVVSERDLHETYLPAFEAGVSEGHAGSVMSAYNAVGGVPVPANARLLGAILRDAWGFKGAVVGDVDTVADIWMPDSHHFARDAAEASAMAIQAGNDLCSGETYKALPEALRRGIVTQADLDRALARLLRLRFMLGQFDPPSRVPYAAIPISENDSPEHDRLALEAARESLVLLKNDGALPLDPHKVRTIAVIGPTANTMSVMLGNYCGTPARPRTLLDSLRAKFEPMGIKVLFAQGSALVSGYRERCQPLPPGVLFADEALTQPGLAADVFANRDLQGSPVGRRTDRQVDMKWRTYEEPPGIPMGEASLSWTGWLVPPVTGTYSLGLQVSGSSRLFIDDSLVIDAWEAGDHRAPSVEVKLTAGRAVRVRLDFAQNREVSEIAFGWRVPGTGYDMGLARAAARRADCVVLALGLTPELEGEEMPLDAPGFRGGDRTSVVLPATQADLLREISGSGKPLVVVLTTGSAISFDVAGANAAIVMWYSGQRGGDALAEALLGETNPGGRLPVTFYASDSDLKPFSEYAMAGRTYRYFGGRPLFAFGHGLSYTTFRYGAMELDSPCAGAGDTVAVKLGVENTGTREGDEVVQLYARAAHPAVPMPLQWLVAFQRVRLNPGERRLVELSLPVQRLRRWDEGARRYVVDPGAYGLRVGPSSDKAVQEAFLTVR
jgi:beta-glucosidase